ncbi:hypothetical protein [Fusibacter ferrireducens]|uniref:HTH cro/C1-type domain-containing protein n=1 Tax=Fusibacter ferrireducens TaxID=2785058 RepID=A0ABR9ZMG2_9FIRM|nr:hypothetical protein [Fusibacter ferrireducens]MBF4691640.1 hypothetical protein [Fusibacter ferrireducens]
MSKKKTTEQLINDIVNSNDIKDFLDKNKADLIRKEFHHFLMDIIVEKDLENRDIIEKSQMNRVYFYHLLSGKRKPSRDKIIQLSFGLGLSVEEMQQLLKVSNMKELYSKHKRDAIILFAITHRMSLIETNILLDDENEQLLCE